MGARIATQGLRGWRADAVHAHDWQAGLTPTYLRLAGPEAPRAVITIHNIAFQGLFGRETLAPLALPEAMFHPDHLEFHGHVGFLKAGLAHAERITSVSPSSVSYFVMFVSTHLSFRSPLMSLSGPSVSVLYTPPGLVAFSTLTSSTAW